MGALTHADRRTSFFAQLRSAPSRVLLLDYDGTLAPFQIERDRAVPYPEIPGLLRRIIASGTRVVLISGRPARELRELLDVQPQPEIWGSHGTERLRPDGTYHVQELSPEQGNGLGQAESLVRNQGLETRLERKPSAIALHWRGLGQRAVADLKIRVEPLWSELATRTGLKLIEFDGGLELRTRAEDKGKAVIAILRECNQNAAIAYLGDDRTDEDAFSALQGKGLTVLVRNQYRPTLADIHLRPPGEVLEFLRDWLANSNEEC
ncbi:MAG: trehalose-phosphatase [Acidobacteriaceae bacterium]|nr:trehalose-phosphatase [Acidobacteriaceae bacterium]